MLTPDIIIYAPGFISPTREPWTGTIAEHFTQAGDRAWDKLAAILADHAIDDDLDLDQALEALADAGLADQELASDLFDDPNVTIIDAEELVSEVCGILDASEYRLNPKGGIEYELRNDVIGIGWSLFADGRCGIEYTIGRANDDGGWDYMDNGGVYFTPGVDTAESLAAALLDVAEEATRIARKASNRGIDD